MHISLTKTIFFNDNLEKRGKDLLLYNIITIRVMLTSIAYRSKHGEGCICELDKMQLYF